MNEIRWRVARVDRTRVLALPASGDPEGSRSVPLHAGGVLDAVVGEPLAPTVGDVLVQPDPATDRVLVAPRTGELVRDSADRSSRTQVMAANVDVVLVVEHLDPEPKVGRVERLLTLAWRSGAQPIVVLTKADLATDVEHWLADMEQAAPGVEAVAVSSATGDGIAELRARILPGSTLVVVGPSGAGKSTLVNALVGADAMLTGERRGDGKGRHTTSHRELLAFSLDGGAHPADERAGREQPGIAWLIDTPGLRAVGLVADPDAVSRTFADVAEIAQDCRFSDCAHAGEPGCAIAAALADGTLSERRYASWTTQLREADRQAARADARLAAATRDEWRRRTIAMRTYQRATGKGRR